MKTAQTQTTAVRGNRVPRSELEVHGDYNASFERIRLCDGTVTIVQRRFLSRQHAEQCIEKWNLDQPENWAYRLIEEGRPC